jgi:histone acetyltransferase 1
VGTQSPQFIGYCTAYIFTNPFLKGRTNILRLAQLVILPMYQRQGHGERVLDVLRSAVEKLQCREFSIESPCRGMTLLSDGYHARRFSTNPILASIVARESAKLDAFATLTAEQMSSLHEETRLPTSHIHRLYELSLLLKLNLEDEEQMRRFRLLVKRRIMQEDKELSAVEDVTMRKKLLEDAFQLVWQDYVPLHKKLSNPA